MTPHPTPEPQRARPCPWCRDTDEAFGNVTRLYTREAWMEHFRNRHPGFDGRSAWSFPPEPKARG